MTYDVIGLHISLFTSVQHYVKDAFERDRRSRSKISNGGPESLKKDNTIYIILGPQKKAQNLFCSISKAFGHDAMVARNVLLTPSSIP